MKKKTSNDKFYCGNKMSDMVRAWEEMTFRQ